MCITNTTFCAGCPDTVVVTMPGEAPHTAGDEMTCSSDGYPPATYEWEVDGVTDSTTNTQALLEGEHVYECTATTIDVDNEECSHTFTTDTITAYSTYQEEYHNIVRNLLLMALSGG